MRRLATPGLAVIFLGLIPVACLSPARESRAALNDYKGIIHCHSRFSHDSRGTYEEILAAAKATGIDFIIMTDHPPKDDPVRPLREGWRGIREGVLFIQGAELGRNILALGIDRPVLTKGRQEMIDEIHAQGGLAFICHPEEVGHWDGFDGFDGMEIFNLHAAFKRKAGTPGGTAALLQALKENPGESISLLHELDPAVLKKWDELNRKRRVVGIAGTDAHQNVNILGVQADPYARVFGLVSNHVLAGELSEEAILCALKEGQSYVAFDILGDPRKADPEGRTVQIFNDHWLLASAAAGLRKDFTDGRPDTFESHQAGSVLRITPRGGACRTELWSQTSSQPRPWILLNPIRR